MAAQEKSKKKKRSLTVKLLRIFGWVVVSIIGLVVVILILIQLPFVQNFARKKAVAYLENKLHTRVSIGKLEIDFPSAISLQKVFVEDQHADTLLYGNEIKVDISILRLLRNEMNIQGIYLDGIVANIYRQPPDSAFNFQYIIDAFAGDEKKEPEKENSSPMKISVDEIIIGNSHFNYKDLYAGNDLNVRLNHFKTNIKTIDPSQMLFDISSIEIDGLRGHFFQLEPIPMPAADEGNETVEEPGSVMQLINKTIRLSDVNFQFNSIPSHLKSSFVIGNAELHPREIDLRNMMVALKDASLKSSDIVIEMAAESQKTSPPGTNTTSSEPSMKIMADNLVLENSGFRMDDRSVPPATSGFDYSHLNMTDINVTAKNLLYSSDTTRANIISAKLKDQSGFVLNNMKVKFEMTPTGVNLDDLYIKTPTSEIKRFASITYPSLEALSKDPGVLGLDIDLENSTIALRDFLLFVPQMKSQMASLQNESLFADARITGNVSNLQFQKLILKGLSGTNINIRGSLTGLPNPDKIKTNLDIENFSTTNKVILALVPEGTLPSDINLPSYIQASGILKGGLNELATDLSIRTDLGNGQVKGTLADITDQRNARYNLAVAAQELQLGKILSNPELGIFTGNAKASGTGLDPKTANAEFSVDIPEVNYHRYQYNNITAIGSIQNGGFNADLQVRDPNVSTMLSLSGNFQSEYPAIVLQGVVDSVDMKALNFSATPLKYHGKVLADFSNTNPDSLMGHLAITNSIIVINSERMKLDSLTVIATAGDTNSIFVNTGFASLGLKGQYKLTQLADVFINSVNPYFKISDSLHVNKTDPYHFSITGMVYNNPALKAAIPGLENLETVQMEGAFDSDSGWNFELLSPHINYEAMVIDSLHLKAATKDSVLTLNLAMNRFSSGSSISVYQTSVDGALAHNELKLSLDIQDKAGKQKYFLRSNFFENPDGAYVFSLNPDSLRLNYAGWNIYPENQITFGATGIIAQHFTLMQGDQMLSINSETPESTAPLKLDFSNFKIATLTAFLQSDSSMINGILNGNATVKNLQTQPTFTTDLSVNDLSVYNDTLGVLTAKVNNETANQFSAAITLQGTGNDIAIDGNYFVKPQNSSFDFTIGIHKFQVKSLEGLTDGAIREGRGFVYGNIKVNGNGKNTNIDGSIQFENTSFIPSALNSVFKIDKEAIAIVNNKGIKFNSFTIRDNTNNALTLGGSVNTTDWMHYNFDMTIDAKNFQAINSTQKDNDLFYGKFVFSTSLTIKGTPTQPVVDGDLTVNKDTKFTIVLPTEAPGIAKREGVVRFVDFSAIAKDSLFMTPYDSLGQVPLIGYDVAVNISIDKEAEFNVIVDAANGDFLHMRGTGELSGGIDPSGKINLTGSYEIEEGSYSLSFNFLRRKFLIQQGSKIVWNGDPTRAQVDLTAIYIANTPPYDLVQSMLSENAVYYKQKLPFEVHLIMKGELLKPEITFDVVLPGKNYTVSSEVVNTVDQRLEQLRQEPSELNKQVFALLLLNRFLGSNPFNNSSSESGVMDAGTFAKQSASRLLSDQLNNLTEGLIQGVDLNFELSSTEDYSTGEKQDRTNLNVGVTKRLFNDRLTVTVGNNFELEGSGQSSDNHTGIADNISINYSLSKDGRYMLRAYRNNDYTGTVEGYVIETGLSFIITLDYNKLSEIFKSKKEREKRKDIRRQDKQENAGNNSLQEMQNTTRDTKRKDQ